jgi:hypothetical protein
VKVGGGPGRMDVSISYASVDRSRVTPVVGALESAGMQVWCDLSGIPGGANYGTQIVRGIRRCKVLLLMCSTASLRSRSVKQEIQLAWKYERPILPLLLDEAMVACCPEQVEYWLEGCQWIEVLSRPTGEWLPQVCTALVCLGVLPDGPTPATAPVVAEPPGTEGSLSRLRTLASLTDQIWPVPASTVRQASGAPVTRGLGAPQPHVVHSYPLGSRLRLIVESEVDGHLLLLDEGPEGLVYCLCPSHFAPNTCLPSGRSVLPQRESPYDAFTVSGRPGREHLLAIITRDPLPLAWESTDPSAPARVLVPGDIDRLLGHLRELDTEEWTALATFFAVSE